MTMLKIKTLRALIALLRVPRFSAGSLFRAEVWIVLPLLITSLTATVQAADNSSSETLDLFSLSLEELMQVKTSVPAALTRLTHAETPGAITVITADDIMHTPARNIYDLIEVYVPGAIWMNYEDGPQLGVRGSIANRNFKYLLRVNGRVMNNKGHYGAKSELEQWDLSDIREIEVVRGPGSVTYGPGAVAGVINIITHNAVSAKGLRVAMRYTGRYDSEGLTLSYGHQAEKFSVFTFASFTRTHGFKPHHFVGTNINKPGYIGEDTLLNKEPLDYFADYDEDPQIKLHLDTSFPDHWRLWLRYTQQGSTWLGNEVKSDFNGRLRNQQGTRERQWTATLQYENELREDLSLSVMLSADSSDVERRWDIPEHPDPEHALNKEIDFSETEVFLRAIANWQTRDWIEIALGAEYSWDRFGAGWGDSRRDMRIGERGAIVSSRSSNAMKPGSRNSADRTGTVIFTGDGWNTDTYSLFSEANLTLKPWLKLLLSGRVDKNTYSEWLVSPRVAIISNVAEGHYLKLIVQQSLRMNTAGQNYADNKNDNDPDTEELNGVELIYSAFPTSMLSLNLSSFWNDVEVIAWNEADQSTDSVGDLQLFGIEMDIDYKWSFGSVGANYSWVKQIDWDLASGVPSSGISYSDYNQPLQNSFAVQKGVGNDLNNWPNHALKLFARMTLFDRLTLHADARFLWDFQGLKDGLSGLRRAVGGVKRSIQRVKDVDAYAWDFRLNASVSYEIYKGLAVQVFAQNLLGKHRNKRYSYDFNGNKRAMPHRVRFTEEPRVYGFRIDYHY